MTRPFVILAAFAVALLTVVLQASAAPTTPPTTLTFPRPELPAPLPSGPFAGAIDVTAKNHAQVVEASKQRLILMDFSKESCGPCLELAPRLRGKMAADQDWTWGIANTATQKELWSLYGRPWNPTLIALRGGVEVARHVGYRSDWKGLSTWIDQLRAGKTPASHEVQTDLTSPYAIQRVISLSHTKPVLLRFHQESRLDASYEQRIKLWEKADADGGTWLLGNVDVTTNDGQALAATFHTRAEPALTVFYRGRTWQKLLPSFYGYTLDDPTLTRFVTAMKSATYDPAIPVDSSTMLRATPPLSEPHSAVRVRQGG